MIKACLVYFKLICLLILSGCARFDFNHSSFFSSSSVTITGITGGLDSIVDFYLFDGNIATVNWVDVVGEESYDVFIYENDGTTLVCQASGVPPNSTSHTLLGCSLNEGSSYYALVEANMPVSAISLSRSLASSFSLGPNAYEFLYPSTVTLGDITVMESVGTADLPVTLSAPSDWPVTINFNTTDGTAVSAGIFKDYDLIPSSSFIIPAGVTNAIISVDIDDDPRDEDDQALNVNVSNTTHAKIFAPSAVLTIEDNDPPPFFTTTAVSAEEGLSVAVTLTLNEISEKVINFSYQAADGTATIANGDYALAAPLVATITPGSTDIAITIDTIDDADVCEFDETVLVTFSGETNLTVSAPIAVMIEDNDDPALSLTGGSAIEGDPVPFIATLSDVCLTKTVSFDYHAVGISAVEGFDYPVSANTISFLPGETVINFNVPTIDDGVSELNLKYFSVGARNKTNIRDTQPSAALGTIQDNEAGNETVKVVSSGPRTCALGKNGQIKCWGLNQYIGYDGGHIGDQPNEMGDNLTYLDLGTWDHDNNPVTPNERLKILKIKSNSTNGCAVLENQRLKCWGGSIGNDINQLGDFLAYTDLGTWDHDNNPVTPEIQYLVKDISFEANSSEPNTFCAHLIDDNVKCWGANLRGQTGLIPGDAFVSLTEMLALNQNLDFGTWDHDSNPVTAEIPIKAKYIDMPCAILENDRIKCWGMATDGRLGNGSLNNLGDNPGEMGNALPYVDLGTGRTAKFFKDGCAILDNDDLKCWGYGFFFGNGQFLIGSNIGDNPNEMGDFLPPIDLGDYDHDNNVLTPNIPHTALKVSREHRHICVLLDNYRVKCWGHGLGGKLGRGSNGNLTGAANMGNNLPYVNLGTGRTAKYILTTGYATYIIRDDDSMVSFGENTYGSLGLGFDQNWGDNPAEIGNNLISIDFGINAETSNPHYAIDFGFDIGSGNGNLGGLCAVLDNGLAKCWGFASTSGGHEIPARMKIGDDPSEMGSGRPSIALPTGRTAIDLFESQSWFTAVAGFCAILDDFSFVCWGIDGLISNSGSSGRAGDRPAAMGDYLTQHLPVSSQRPLAIQNKCILDEALDLNCWGRSWESLGGPIGDTGPIPSNGFLALVGSNRKVLSFSKTRNHGCVLLDNYDIKCFGSEAASMGYEGLSNIGGNLATSGDNLPAVNLGSVSYPVEISAAEGSTCARFANGLIKCWGLGNSGLIASGGTSNRGDTPGSMGDSLPFVNTAGGIKKLFALKHVFGARCALKTNDNLICWGSGSSGKLGNASGSNIGDNLSELGLNLPVIDLNGSIPLQIESSSEHACALNTDSTVKCWGSNFWGELGLGDISNRGDNPGEMGSSLPAVNLTW